MKHLKFGYPLIGAVAAVAMLAGCADESPWGNTSKEQGSISVSLKTDSGIKTAKPVFRSGEDDETRSTGDPNDLSTYITTLPSVDDFVITLTNSKDQPIKQCTYGEFKEAVKTEKFAADIYTLTASIQGVDPDETVTDGQKHSTNGFNCYYFEGSTTFTVIPNRETKVDLTAELKKSMVKVNFDQSFIDYVEEGFSAYVHNSNDIKLIPFVNGETKAAFIDPTTAELTTHFTTNVTGKEQTATVKIGDFQAVAKTLHNITLAIDNSKNGFASLTVKFDKTVEGNTDVNVNLTDDLYDTSAPEIECTGFANNSYNDISGSIAEGTTYSMTVNAPGGLKTASLTLEGKTIGGKGTFDLLQTDDVTTLTNEGITAKYFTSGSAIATLDFTEFVRQLSTDEKCTIMLAVSDQKDKTYIYKDDLGNDVEGAKVIFDKKAVTVNQQAEGTSTDHVVYGSNKAYMNLEYNGEIKDLTFTTSDGDAITYSQPKKIVTRGKESKWYSFALDLPRTYTSNEVTIIAKHKGSVIKPIVLPVNVPEYTISSVDAFSKYAYLKISTPGLDDKNVIAALTEKISIINSSTTLKIADERYASKGIFIVTGLTPATAHTIGFSIAGATDNYKPSATFTTETEQQIENGNFSETTEIINHKDVETGGRYRYSVQYQATANIVISEANNWASINAKTCWFECNGAKNTWFQVPSTYAENEAVVIRNVAYDHNGTKPADMSSNCWYNPNVPNFTTFAAGELFLGSYSYDGTEHRVDGVNFENRPSAITFDYSYKPTGRDQAEVEIKVLGADGKPIASGSMVLNASTEYKNITVPLSEYPFNSVPAKLLICFKSSTSSNPKEYVHIPNGSELDEGFGPWNFGNKNLGNNNYKAVATGSELTIDNVKANYNYIAKDTPSGAPKKKTTKRK